MFKISEENNEKLKKMAEYKNESLENILNQIIEKYYEIYFSDKNIFDTLKTKKSGRKVMCYLPDGSKKIFNSITEASKETGAKGSAICWCCNGKMVKTHGMTFRYFD